ncbi:hypothetical protein O1L60_39050 [Streptomyces diastatochromogenes]|nr:hypothetical protein [Streptomyces diastatochromogenes]MCZ0982903.1 hypothetical protein [Streptomyces diastatochromogenes]
MFDATLCSQRSAIRPSSSNRQMTMPTDRNERPVGAMPSSSPRWVPRQVLWMTTMSSWALMSSMVTWKSGNASRSPAMVYFTPSAPSGAPGRPAWSTMSGR